MTTTNDKYLLYKYLIIQAQKDFNISEQEATEYTEHLMKSNTNHFGKHGLCYELGGKNLEFFCMYFLEQIFAGEGCAEISPIHREIWQEIEDIILRKTHDKQAYLLPRGTGKSSFVSLASSIWCSLYKYKRYTVIASAVGDTANTFIRNIRMAVAENKKIEMAFGEIYNSKKCIDNTEQIEFCNKTMIQSISASSTLRGKSYGNIRIELLLLDDYQKDDEVKTDEQREKKWKRFSDDVNYAMQKDNATMIACGTIQHKECFYSRLYDSPTWRSRKEKGVLIDDVDEYFNLNPLWAEFKKILFNKMDKDRLDNAKDFYKENKDEMQYPLLWQQYWCCLEMSLAYYENSNSFKQEVQGNVHSIGQKRFTTIVTEKEEVMEEMEFRSTMLCIDPAGINNKHKKSKDNFAFLVGSIDYNNIKYVRKGDLRRFEDFNQYLTHVLDLLRKYKDISHVYVERNSYMGLDVQRLKEMIDEDTELRNREIEWINEGSYKNKDDKINTIVADVNMGRIIFNESDEEFIEEIKEFAGVDFSLQDGAPDITSEFANRITKIEEVAQYVTVHSRAKLGI